MKSTAIITAASVAVSASAFQQPISVPLRVGRACRSALTKHHGYHTRLHSTAAPNDTRTKNPLGGVEIFEEWFSANSGAEANSIKHALFHSDSLRGLEFTSTKSSDLSKVAVVPRSLVLSAPFSDDDDEEGGRSWDTNLSLKLWQECKKGKESKYYGYTALLTRGENLLNSQSPYPSTAPDSLRHWSDDEKAMLEKSENGKKLLDFEQKQQKEWRQKYNSLSTSETTNMSYEDFQWAMEAVHSRAFRGDFGALDGGEGGPLRKLASLLLPFSALAFGVFYAIDPTMGKAQYFLPLSIVAAAPVVLTIIADQKGSKEAVLLPLIDSANHLEEADSVIEYDDGKFVLSLGRKCVVKEVDEGRERAQVCISYGVRKDSELLLNYGFMRGVTMDGVKTGDEGDDRSEIRKRLADAFLERY